MTKIDPTKKPTTALTPDAESVAETIQSAADYTNRVKAKQAQMSSAKAMSKAVGGAPPISADRLRQAMPMVQPNWDDPTEDPGEFTPPSAPRQVQQPPPHPGGGVGAAYEVNQALSGGGLKEPISVAQAKQQGMGIQQNAPEAEVVNDPEPAEEPDEPTEDDFDFGELGRIRNQLISKERREAIEVHLKPLNVADLITTNEIRQTVPSIPGQLEYELRTIAEHEHLYCMQYVYDYSGSPRFIEELFNTAKIACSVVAINGKVLPEHRKKLGSRDEEVDKDLFAKKISVVKRFATQLLADVGVQLSWFNERVNQLFSVEKIKNG